MAVPETIGQLFFDQAEKFGKKTALLYKQLNPLYQSMSWEDFARLVEEIACGLLAVGVDVQDTVAIFSQTSYLWVASDLASISLGGISVPIYPNSSTADIEYILANAQVKVIFVAGEKQLNKLATVAEQMDHLQKIVYLPSLTKKEPEWQVLKDKYAPIQDKLMHLSELCSMSGAGSAGNNAAVIKERLNQGKAQDVATIIYTSGTTGTPKGVPLTHSNILSVLHSLPDIIPISQGDTYFSYLPISHVFERVCGEYYWIYSGCVCAFAESIETMAKNLKEIQPSVMVMVPRVLESVYTKVQHGINAASEQGKKLVNWAVSVGAEVVQCKAADKKLSSVLRIKHWLADSLVLSKLRQRVGERLRFIVCGGAPAAPHVVSFFNALGIPALEGYGLTETSAPTNVNRLHKVKPGTVGPTLPCVEIKIAEDGEVLLKGASIFREYFRDPQSTGEAFVDGWFATGDVGLIDQDGYLKITDRKKDLIVNAAGKNIAPQRIENVLKTIEPVSQVVVFGDRNKHLVALFTLDEHKATELAKKRGWQYNNYRDLAKSTEMHQYLKKEVNNKRAELAEYEQVKHFTVLDKDLSVDSGELTATLKIKRTVVAEKYADKLERLYASSVN